MKIVSVCKVYPTLRSGGMGFVCQDRARALVAAGHEAHVLTTGGGLPPGVYRQDEDDHGVQVHYANSEPWTYSTEFATFCVEQCKHLAPEVIHLDSFDSDRHWWLDQPGNPKVTAVTLHGFGWGAYFTQLNLWARHGGEFPQINSPSMVREYSILRGFQRVIGISIHEHWMLRDLLGLFDSRLVYNPIAEVFFKYPQEPPPKSPRYLCAAVSGYRERGFDMAQEAAIRAGVQLDTWRSASREQVADGMYKYTGLVLPTCYAQGCDLAVGEMIVKRRIVIATATGSYLREAEKGGAYHGAVQLVPLCDVGALATAMLHPRRYEARDVRIDAHHPAVHAKKWLEAIT